MWPIHSVVPPQAAGECAKHKLSDVCPSIFLSLLTIWEGLRRFAPQRMSHFVINVGANDGVVDDPLYPLVAQWPNMSGLALEPYAPRYAALVRNLRPFPNYKPVKLGITPDQISTVLRAVPNPSPESIDILKIVRASRIVHMHTRGPPSPRSHASNCPRHPIGAT